MKKQDFQCEHLKQLPLRAIVAFSVRCARRVQGLCDLPDGHAGKKRLRDDVETALGMAEAFASGSTSPFSDSVIEALDESRHAAGIPLAAGSAATAASETAHAASTAWHLTAAAQEETHGPRETRTAEARRASSARSRVSADLAALNAYTAALSAYEALGLRNEDYVTSALNDYETLLRLKLGHYPDAGAPIDASPRGPLGPL